MHVPIPGPSMQPLERKEIGSGFDELQRGDKDDTCERRMRMTAARDLSTIIRAIVRRHRRNHGVCEGVFFFLSFSSFL